MDNDPVLVPLLHAPDEPSAARAVADLLAEQAEPLVRDIIRKRMRTALDRQQIDDLCQDVLMQLFARLGTGRTSPDDGIADFTRYAAAVAHRACDAQVRQKFPGRARLKSRVRYALARHHAFALDDTGPRWSCRLRRWPAEAAASSGFARLQELQRLGRVPGIDAADLGRVSLILLLDAVLDFCAAPVDLNDLVSLLAALLRVDDRPAPIEDHGGAGAAWWERLVDARATVADELETREYFARLWAEIGALPLRQRIALLLNLRDDRGCGVIPLIVLTGTASATGIAAVLEIEPSELDEIWPRLPLDDTELGRRLSLTRQQIINLRKAARLRLKRSLRRFLDPSARGSGHMKTGSS